MSESVSIDQAIRKGLLVVNAPVMLLLFGPATVAHYLVGKSPIVVAAAVIGFVLAWLWWSVSVPRWRLWAYERVADIPQLKQRAVEVGLTWKDGSLFSRTEIKSADMAARERSLDPGGDPASIEAATAKHEEAVIVHFEYRQKDWSRFFELEKSLEEAIAQAAVGEYDGNELATDGSDGSMFMYGPSADALFAIVEPRLLSASFLRNVVVTLRYGDITDPAAREKKVSLGP